MTYQPVPHTCPYCLRRSLLRHGERLAVWETHPVSEQNGRKDATRCHHEVCRDEDCEHAEHARFIS